VSIIKTTIVDKRPEPDEVVEADLHLEFTPDDLFQTELAWGPVRLSAIQRLYSGGFPAEQMPQHYHWNWASKGKNLRLLAYRCFGIRCEGEVQGLMMMNLAGHFAQLDPDRGKPILYIDYLESAPWNVVPFTSKPRFGGIGTRLFDVAVRTSEDEGFAGRVGLHSLPQTELFYNAVCGMTPGDPDPNYQGLRYFEFTREHARKYLHGAA